MTLAKFQLMILGIESMRIKNGIYNDILNIRIRVNNLSIPNKTEVKLPGVIIDRKLNFATYIQISANKKLIKESKPFCS